MPHITVDQVRERVSLIEQSKWDGEKAHSLEDALHRDVLEALAAGVRGGRSLATAALRTREIEFPRWCG
jgi:hypothetical protein